MPVFSLCSAGVLLVLLMLGHWQWRRAEWKLGLLEQSRMQASLPEPASLQVALCEDGVRPFPAGLAGAWKARPVFVYGRDVSGRPGWREFVGIAAPSCMGRRGLILAERGFRADRAGSPLVPTERLRLADWPERPAFAPDNRADKNEWYWFDAGAMAQSIGTDLVRTMILFNAEYRRDALNRVPPVRHYGYAVTWFGMALALIGVYIVYHRQAGRL